MENRTCQGPFTCNQQQEFEIFQLNKIYKFKWKVQEYKLKTILKIRNNVILIYHILEAHKKIRKS